MRKLQVLFYMLILQPGLAFCQYSGYTRVIWPGDYLIKLEHPDADSVTCSLKISKPSPTMLRKTWWGVYEESPISVVDDITFSVDGKKIGTPLSSFADLSNTQYAKLSKTNAGYRLVILGGDGASSYRTSIDFNKIRVTRRHIYGGAATAKSSEITDYGPYEPFTF